MKEISQFQPQTASGYGGQIFRLVTRSHSMKKRSGTKLESTSLSTDVFQGSPAGISARCTRMLSGAETAKFRNRRPFQDAYMAGMCYN